MLQTWGILQLTRVEDRQLARCDLEWRLYFSSCKEKGGISQNWSHLSKKKVQQWCCEQENYFLSEKLQCRKCPSATPDIQAAPLSSRVALRTAWSAFKTCKDSTAVLCLSLFGSPL